MNSTETHPLLYFISGGLLLLPFVLGWWWLFRRFRQRFKTARHYSVLALVTLVCLLIYGGLWAHAGVYIGGKTGDLLWAPSAVLIMGIIWAFWPVVALTLILTVVRIIKKGNRAND
jgi:hypothetical protein